MRVSRFSSASIYALSRIVEGAIKNAADAHPDWLLNREFVFSVNKRLISALVKRWPEIFLLTSQTEIKVPATLRKNHPSSIFHAKKTTLKKRLQKRHNAIEALESTLGEMARQARENGNQERYTAIVDILRLIGKKKTAISLSQEEHKTFSE